MVAIQTIYKIPGFPTVHLTNDGIQIAIRPMLPDDKDALIEFFRRIPEEDRFYLKEDVASEKVIERWCVNLDYSRALPWLAIIGDRIIADGTLHRNRAGARRHVGEVRIVVEPAYRNRGLGRGLLHKLAEIAKDRGVTRLKFEVVADKEEAARRTAMIQGFVPEAVLKNYVADFDGNPHDLIIMDMNIDKTLPDEEHWF